MQQTITTGFVKALGIDTQKIEVKDKNGNVLFLADTDTKVANQVLIGGFGVKRFKDSNNIEHGAIYSGMIDSMDTIITEENATGIYLGTDGLRIGNKFKVDADGTAHVSGLEIDTDQLDINLDELKLHVDPSKTKFAINQSSSAAPENGWSDNIPENVKPG